mgnify:CR=1 FL=1
MLRYTGVRSSVVAGLTLVALVCASVTQAGMSQGGLLFRAKEAAPAAAAPAFRPTPVPITRESTAIKLTLTAKYGDEEDKELRRYGATFESKYVIRCQEKPDKPKAGQKPKEKKVEIVVFFPFPGSADTVPDAKLRVNDREPEDVRYTQDGVSCELVFKPQEKKEVTVSYRAFGTDDFVYMLDHGERIKALDCAATIQGTQRKPQLPAKECLEPTTPLTRDGDTYSVAWSHQDLLTKRDIIIKIPAPIVGSDIASRMPNLLRTGVVSLVLGNLGRNQGRRFALTYGVFGLVTIVGLYSIAVLLTKGAGTLITIASFILIAYVMYAVPKLPSVLPARKPGRTIPRPPMPPPPPEGAGDGLSEKTVVVAPAEPAAASAAPAPEQARAEQFCVHCGCAVAETFAFCPGCGGQAHVSHQCAHCGTALCSECSPDYRYCPGCGRDFRMP